MAVRPEEVTNSVSDQMEVSLIRPQLIVRVGETVEPHEITVYVAYRAFAHGINGLSCSERLDGTINNNPTLADFLLERGNLATLREYLTHNLSPLTTISPINSKALAERRREVNSAGIVAETLAERLNQLYPGERKKKHHLQDPEYTYRREHIGKIQDLVYVIRTRDRR